VVWVGGLRPPEEDGGADADRTRDLQSAILDLAFHAGSPRSFPVTRERR
jgi:hypothetical protein